MHLGPGRLPDRGAAPLPYTPQRFRCGPRYGEGHPQLVAFFCHLPRIDHLPRDAHARIYRERPNLVRELYVSPELRVPWACLVVKCFGWRGRQHYLSSPLKRARAMKAYHTACHLLAHGLPTPLPLGVFAERRWGFLQYNVYVTEALRDAVTLSYYRTTLREGDAGLDEVLRLVATYTRGMHDSGLWHRDMVSSNFLLTGTPGNQQLYLVDLNRARRLPYMPVWLRAIDLARMDWRDAQPRFCALYCGERFSPTYVLRLIRIYRTWRTGRRWVLRGVKSLRQRLKREHRAFR